LVVANPVGDLPLSGNRETGVAVALEAEVNERAPKAELKVRILLP
jgi:hypothetical protein